MNKDKLLEAFWPRLSRIASTYEAIPHSPNPENGGTEFFVNYGYEMPIQQIDGIGNGGRWVELDSTSESQILENIEAAEKQREDSEMKLKEYEEIISKSKLEAKTIFNQAREKALKDINAKKEVLEGQIDEEISKAEEEIKTLRNGAPDKINKIAIETSSELIQKLIGAEVNNSSISAIVDDLSRRSGDKYYGN